jgi:N-acyl-phosphatidylethanolamine-hydrolysing phospholipase D
MHFGTFPLTDEVIDEPPQRLAAALERDGIEAGRFRVPRFGETLVVSPRPVTASGTA